jgi:hypothetical protein
MPAVNIIFGELKLHSMFSINDEKKATLTIVNAENMTETVIYSSPIADVELRGGRECHTKDRRYKYVHEAISVYECSGDRGK